MLKVIFIITKLLLRQDN